MKTLDMPSRIDIELNGQEAANIKHLNLDNCVSAQIDGLTDDFANLETLSLINVGLTTLKGFPALPNLKRLELSENQILNGLQFLLGCTNLTHLNLSGNKIQELDVLGPLAKLEKLSHLEIMNCEIPDVEENRTKIFKMLPNLKYLDGFDINDHEDEEEYGCEDDDEEESDDEEEEADESTGVGLSYLQKSNLGDEEDDADFEEGDDEEEEEEGEEGGDDNDDGGEVAHEAENENGVEVDEGVAVGGEEVAEEGEGRKRKHEECENENEEDE